MTYPLFDIIKKGRGRMQEKDEQKLPADGIFWHECITPGCNTQVEFDDEPWCFRHSPDGGSSKPGYSAFEETNK